MESGLCHTFITLVGENVVVGDAEGSVVGVVVVGAMVGGKGDVEVGAGVGGTLSICTAGSLRSRRRKAPRAFQQASRSVCDSFPVGILFEASQMTI